MLKEAILRTSCLDAVTGAGGRTDMPREVLAERLILALYAYGTNTGIKAIAGAGHSERDIRYVRQRYLTADVARVIATQIANATFAVRERAVWGAGTTTVASDSTHFAAYDQNILTEWHSRYRGRGVLIYWHVDRKSMAIHSQLISCSASEVAAMVEGAMHHDTTMNVEGNYTDSHGQSEIGFGITRLLGFDLLPRIKRINKTRLYRPAAGEPDRYQALEPALTRPIRWELIAEQYDQMIRYATAIRSGTASTEAILRRFTRARAMHPTYQAMIEVGRAQRTIFIARYLRDRELQREINAGLNVMESWNRANSVIFYGKGGDIAANRREEQELSVAALRVLQSALVYVNTLMVQDVLGAPAAPDLASEDLRGLTPLFWSHIRPYGEVRLDLGDRLQLSAA
jgi:TnpA family transposase